MRSAAKSLHANAAICFSSGFWIDAQPVELPVELMKLDQIVPFGRSLDEYSHMFALSEADFRRSILSVADGPASFNAEGTAKGYQIQSCDPLYVFGVSEIRDRFYSVLDDVMTQVENTRDSWVWTYHRSPADLKRNRIEVAERFLADYELGKAAGRYEVGSLPDLSYQPAQFDLSLSSHFLFLYSEQLDLDFHIAAIAEMLRVSSEVRIFPLLTLAQQRSPHLQPVLDHLSTQGYCCEIKTADYELQPSGNEMLRISTDRSL